jgi:hypothetical protein
VLTTPQRFAEQQRECSKSANALPRASPTRLPKTLT